MSDQFHWNSVIIRTNHECYETVYISKIRLCQNDTFNKFCDAELITNITIIDVTTFNLESNSNYMLMASSWT